jgi:hypothetical protein
MGFLLIHGGWQGGWCWDSVATALRELGHEVHAPTLRGLESGDVDRSGVTLTEMTARIAADIRERDLRELVAVGPAEVVRRFSLFMKPILDDLAGLCSSTPGFSTTVNAYMTSSLKSSRRDCRQRQMRCPIGLSRCQRNCGAGR